MRQSAARAIRVARRAAIFSSVFALAALLLLPSFGAALGSEGSPAATDGKAVPPAVATINPEVLWNGANASSAGSPSSAFAVAQGETANVTFRCTMGTLHIACPVTNASLTLTFLGIAVTTSQSPFSGAHGESATINWSFGSLSQLTEGAYELKAVMLNATGGDVWSESFYIDVKAPVDRLESGLTIFLIILSLAEIYAIVAAIRGARGPRRARAAAAGPATPPSGTGAPPSGPAPEAPPPPPPSDAPVDVGGPSPPPEGGGP